MTSYEYDPVLAILHLQRADPQLGRVIARVGVFGLGVRRPHSTFQELLRAIVYQQLSGHAARRIHERVCALFPAKRGPTPTDILTADDSTLRGAGMSRAKIAAAKDLARRARARSLPGLNRLRSMPDEEVISLLTAVRGIGPWTVEMFLMHKLGRPDVLPATDLGVRKGCQAIYALSVLPKPAQVLALGERWRPYRSVAAWYLWRAVDLSGPEEGTGVGALEACPGDEGS